MSINASLDEIKKSYRKLAMHYHPDKKPYGNADIFKKINQAYCVLSDVSLKQMYDNSLQSQFARKTTFFDSKFSKVKSFIFNPAKEFNIDDPIIGARIRKAMKNLEKASGELL